MPLFQDTKNPWKGLTIQKRTYFRWIGEQGYVEWNSILVPIVTDLDLRTGTGTTGYLRTESEPRKKWSSLIIKNFNLDLFLRQKETTYIRKVSDLKF